MNKKFLIALEGSILGLIIVLPIFYLLSLLIAPGYHLIHLKSLIGHELFFMITLFILGIINNRLEGETGWIIKKERLMSYLPGVIIGVISSIPIGVILLLMAQSVIILNAGLVHPNFNITYNG